MDGYLFIFFLINYNCNEKNLISNSKYNKINHMYLYDDNCNVEIEIKETKKFCMNFRVVTHPE